MINQNLVKRNIFNIAGAIGGLATSIAGLVVASNEVYIGSSTKFGADFYTYIYNATRSTGYAVNAVSGAIGTAMFFVGLVAICYFANNIMASIFASKQEEFLSEIINNQCKANDSLNNINEIFSSQKEQKTEE